MRASLKNFKEAYIDSANLKKSEGSFTYNYLIGIAMLYMMFMILSGITIYKIVSVGWFVFPAALLVTPFIYSLSNITTEVYGYRVARNMLWWFVFSSTVFTLFGFLLANAPSPTSFHDQHAYSLILGHMPIVYVAGIAGSLLGMSFNNYFVSKTKVLFSGKKYWIRSIVSTVGGELMYNIVAYPIMFLTHVPFKVFVHIFISVSIFKTCITAVVWPLECFLASHLKRKERTNVMDVNVNYNIFKFKLFDENLKSTLRVVK